MVTYVSTTEWTKEQWIEYRRNYIGASEVPIILGVDSYTSPLQLYNQKKGLVELDPYIGERALAGLAFENVIAETWSSITGYKIRQDNKIRFHPKLYFLASNLDRTIVSRDDSGPGILEIKMTSANNLKNWLELNIKDDLFYHHYTQVQTQLLVTGYKWAVIAALPSDNYQGFGMPKSFEIYPDEKFHRKIELAAEKFWNDHIVKNVPPEPTFMDEVKEIYKKSQPGKDLKVDINDPVYGALKIMVAAKQKIKHETELKENSQLLVMKAMQEADTVIDANDNIICTWKNDKPKREFDLEKFKNEQSETYKICQTLVFDEDKLRGMFPTLYAEYLNEVPGSRRFLTKDKFFEV